MGILKAILKHKSTIFAVASAVATVSAVYFCHEETKKAEEDKKDINLEVEDTVGKTKFYAKHYWKTAACAAGALTTLALTKRADAKVIGTLTMAVGALSAQNQDIQEAVRTVASPEDRNKISEHIVKKHSKEARNAQSNLKKLANIDKIDVMVPFIDNPIQTTNNKLLYAENESNYILHTRYSMPYWQWLEFLGVDLKKLSKKEKEAITDLGWYMDSDEQSWNASFTPGQTIWIKHNYGYNQEIDKLVVYFDIPPVYDPWGPSGEYTIEEVKQARSDKA